MFKHLFEALNKRSIFVRTVKELSALSDRELIDLGIHRGMIDIIARESAYGVTK